MAEAVAQIPTCVECGTRWLPADEQRWRAYVGCDEHRDEPGELFFYSPDCAAREFGDG